MEITTGLANWAFTEVLSGLTEDQLVVVNVDKPGLQGRRIGERCQRIAMISLSRDQTSVYRR